MRVSDVPSQRVDGSRDVFEYLGPFWLAPRTELTLTAVRRHAVFPIALISPVSAPNRSSRSPATSLPLLVRLVLCTTLPVSSLRSRDGSTTRRQCRPGAQDRQGQSGRGQREATRSANPQTYHCCERRQRGRRADRRTPWPLNGFSRMQPRMASLKKPGPHLSSLPPDLAGLSPSKGGESS